MDHEKALEKIRKLLALGESDNAHESASAIARAAALMERFDIAEADVSDGTEEDVISEELFGIEGTPRSGLFGRKSTWQGELAAVIARAFGCAAIWRSGSTVRLKIAGRPQDVQTAIEVKDFCHQEIDRLTAANAHGSGRRYANSFRLGCVDAIYSAIRAERDALHAELQGQVSEKALVVVDDRSKKAMDSFGKTRKSRARHSPDIDAYVSGKIVGGSIWAGTKKRISA